MLLKLIEKSCLAPSIAFVLPNYRNYRIAKRCSLFRRELANELNKISWKLQHNPSAKTFRKSPWTSLAVKIAIRASSSFAYIALNTKGLPIRHVIRAAPAQWNLVISLKATESWFEGLITDSALIVVLLKQCLLFGFWQVCSRHDNRDFRRSKTVRVFTTVSSCFYVATEFVAEFTHSAIEVLLPCKLQQFGTEHPSAGKRITFRPKTLKYPYLNIARFAIKSVDVLSDVHLFKCLRNSDDRTEHRKYSRRYAGSISRVCKQLRRSYLQELRLPRIHINRYYRKKASVSLPPNGLYIIYPQRGFAYAY